MTDRTTHRQAKDSVFIDLFSRPEYQLQMLHVFHPEIPCLFGTTSSAIPTAR